MKTYKLQNSIKLKEIGTFPQIQKVSKGYDLNKIDSIYNITKFTDSFPDPAPDFSALAPETKAKMTDYISCAYINPYSGLLVNSKLKELLQKHELPPHKFYEFSITDRNGNSYNYNWMHFLSPKYAEEWINLRKSKFILQPDKIAININSPSDYAEKKSKLKGHQYIQAELASLYKQPYFDLFQIGFGDFAIYISERLKESFINNNISGIDITETKNILFI